MTRVAWPVGERRSPAYSREAQERLLVLSRRWTLPILLELIDGPHRFSSLKRSLPDVSANMLAQRLRELVGASMVVKASLPPPAQVNVYDISGELSELEPTLRALKTWVAAGGREHGRARDFQ